MDQRRLLGLSGRLYSSPISDFWQVSTTDQDPSVPNLPLETAESGAPVDQPQGSDWDWDEQLPTDLFILGYQNSDATPVLSQVFSDGWNWEESLDDEWPTDQQLQPVVIVPDQPQDTVWDWDEVLSPEIISGGYQQADNAPAIDPIQHTDGGWDWSEPIADEWAADQVISVTAAVSPIQYSNHEWDWDEVLSPEIVVNGYQQADNTPAPSPDQVFDTGWEFEAVSDEDGWSNHFTNYDPIESKFYEHDWDWSEVVYDDAIDYQTTVANAAVVTDPIQHTTAEWDWDEVLYPELVVSGYQQADNAAPVSSDQASQTEWEFGADLSDEDGWNNHFTSYDPETQTFDDPWDWDESCEYEWQDESKPVVANNAPVISPVQHTTAEWDWDETVENEWQDYRDAPVGPDGAVVEDQEPRRGRRHSGFRAIKDEKFQFEGAFVSAEAGAVSVTTQQEAPLPKFDAPQVAPQSAPAAPAQPSVSVSWVLQTAVATAVTGISTVRTTTSARFAVSGASVDTTTVSAEFVLTSAETTTESGDFDDVYTEDNFTDEELLTFALSALK